MNRDCSNDALRYLLDELDAGARAAFECRVASDPAVATALKSTADALAGFAREVAPAEAMDPVAQRQALTRILAATVAGPRQGSAFVLWRRWKWPLAASLLLVLNLWQLLHSVITPAVPTDVKSRSGQANVAPGTGERGAGVAGERPDGMAGAVAMAPGSLATVSVGAEELRRLREIGVKHERLGKAYDRLRAEHDVLMEQVVRFAQAGPGVTRLTMMELADPENYAAGRRKGLLDLALSVLTEPGIIALEPDAPGPDDSGNGSPNTDPTNPATDPGAANTVPDTTGPTDAGETDPDDPYAWSVYDEAQSRGFLNLYNLPEPAANESLQLWVRIEEGGDYVRVGDVPERYYGGSGSIAYALPGVLHAPTEILITSEPRGQVPAQPAGTTVLRGP